MDEVVILYSGGLDSLVMKAMAPDATLLWVDLGQPYADREWAAVRKTAPHARRLDCRVMNVPGYVGQNEQIVPGRNLLLVTLAASFGSRVWLGALHGETHPYSNRDKSHEFRHTMSGVLTYNFLPVRSETIVQYPLGSMTKREVVALGLELGLTVRDFAKTTSCYEQTSDLPCGACAACFHRWIGMTLNDVTEFYAEPPWQSARAHRESTAMLDALARQDFSYYAPERIADTMEALRLAGADL